MADERDPKVSQRYRELGAEEPSRELDQSILAAAHRVADKPHAPLVTPSGRHRWYFSLGAAAVIVLAVAVTYHVQQEVPDPDSGAIPPAPEAQKAPAPAGKPETAREPAAPAPPVFAPDPKAQSLERPRELAREAPGARSDSAGAAASRPETAATESPMEQRRAAPEMRAQRDAVPAESRVEQREPIPAQQEPIRAQEEPIAPAPVEASRPAPQPQAAAKPAPPAPAAAPAPPPPEVRGLMSDSMRYEPPERWLERIVQLRTEGRHDEADKLLAEFKQRYPDYKIPGATLERIERR